MAKYKAVVHFKKSFADTISNRQLEMIEYFKEHHCNVTSIEEIGVKRGSKIMFRHTVLFEDGVGGIEFSNISEMLINMDDMEFISITERPK